MCLGIGLILAGAEQTSTYMPCSLQSQGLPGQVLKSAFLYPQIEAATVVTFQFILRGEAIGVLDCHGKERRTAAKDTKLLPMTCWACPKCEQLPCRNAERIFLMSFKGRVDYGAWRGDGVVVEGLDFGSVHVN